MNRFLPALILIIGCSPIGWADSATDGTTDTNTTVQQPAGPETDADSAASPYAPGRAFGRRIQTEVLEAITRAIEEDPDLSAADKQAAQQALQNGSRNIDLDLDFDQADDAGELVLGGLAILLIFGTPIMLVSAFLYAGHRKRRLASDMAGRFLANGQTIPPEVWRGLAGDPTPRSNLHKGMIMLGAGLGIFLCFWLIGSMKAAYLGLIPMFIGIAQLLIWKLEQQKTSPQE